MTPAIRLLKKQKIPYKVHHYEYVQNDIMIYTILPLLTSVDFNLFVILINHKEYNSHPNKFKYKHSTKTNIRY